MNNTTTETARLKSGREVQVLIIPASELSESPETRAYEAADAARAAGCTHFKIVAPHPAGGTYIAQYGAASAPVLTDAQAQRRSDGTR